MLTFLKSLLMYIEFGYKYLHLDTKIYKELVIFIYNF